MKLPYDLETPRKTSFCRSLALLGQNHVSTTETSFVFSFETFTQY